MKTFFLLLFVIIPYCCFSQDDTCYSYIELGIGYPPVKNDSQMVITKLYFDTLDVDHLRFDEDWEWREPTQGIYNWNSIHSRIGWIIQNNYKLLLTIKPNGPDWACNTQVQNDYACLIEDTVSFKKYLDSLFTRYAEYIDKVQFGNETLSEDFWPGNMEDFVTLNNITYDRLKNISPQTPFVLSGFSSGVLMRYAACHTTEFFTFYYKYWITSQYSEDSLCAKTWVQEEAQKLEYLLANAHYDMVDLHLYDDVEIWNYKYDVIRDLVPDKPFIVGEFGGPHTYAETDAADETYQADRLYQYIKTLDSLKFNYPDTTDVYYFKLIERGNDSTSHGYSGLLALQGDTSVRRKPTFDIYEAFEPCTPVSIHHHPDNSSTGTVYPNPVYYNSVITVENRDNSIHTLYIYDTSGKRIKKEDFYGNKAEINKKDYSGGLYFYYILKNNSIICKGKFIIL